MAYKGNSHKSPNAVLALGVALLFLLPLTGLLFSAQTDAFRVSLEDHNRADLELQQFQYDAERSTLVQVYDWVGFITDDHGNVTDLEFTIKAPESYNAIPFKSLVLETPQCAFYFSNNPFMGKQVIQVKVLQDPQGWYNQNMFGPGTTLRISLSGLNITPGEEIQFYFFSNWAEGGSGLNRVTNVDKYFPPVFSSETTKTAHPYIIPVLLRGGRYPDINKSWQINNSTIIENKTLLINSDLVVRSGGSLVLRNSSLVFNSTHILQYKMTVLEGGNFQMQNSTITMANTTVINKTDYLTMGYSLFLLGNATIKESTIEYFNRVLIVSDRVSIESTTLGAIRDKENATAWNGDFVVQEASPHINDSIFYSDLVLKSSKVTMIGDKINYHKSTISDSVVLLDKFEVVTPDWLFSGLNNRIEFSNSALTVNNSSFIGSLAGISSHPSQYGKESLTVTHSSYDGKGNNYYYQGGIFVDFNGANIIFNENIVSNGYVGLQIGYFTNYPTIATVEENTFINISQPVAASNALLTVKDNKFLDAPMNHITLPISDFVYTAIIIYSDSLIPIRPSFKLRNTGDHSEYSDFEESSGCDLEIHPKQPRWCAYSYLYANVLAIQYDGTRVDLSNYEVVFSSGLWKKTVNFKVTAGYEDMKYFIKITDGSFYPVLIIILAFYIMIAIIIVSQRKFNRVIDKNERPNYEEDGNAKQKKGTIPLPIMGNKEPPKHNQKKKAT
jgi:hypothetical protein